MGLTQVQIPYRDNLDYGIGVDLATTSPMGKVVEGEVSGVTGAGGAVTTYEIARIHTTHDLETKLGISAEASYGAGMFGSVSARFDYAKSSKVQESSLFLSITANVTLAVHSIDAPALGARAAALVGTPAVFAERYGNMFVRGIGRGGLFVAVIQINTADSESSEAISASLSGSYGLFSASAKTKFEQIQRDHRSEIQIMVYHEGGPTDLTMADMTDPVQLYGMLQAWLKSFQDNPDANARPYYVTLAPIAIADGPLPPNAADIQHAQDVLVACAKQRSALLDGMNLMEFILQHPARYAFTAPVTVETVAAAFRGYQLDLELIADAASAAINNPADAMMPAAFAAKAGRAYPQGIPPSPLPELDKGLRGVYAAKGQRLALADPLLAAMREREPEGPSRLGFDMGVALCETDTLWGPGKQAFVDGLSPAEQVGCMVASNFAIARNASLELATKGAAIAAKETAPEILAARAAEAPGLYTLGFDVATGIFGNPALGALGNTATGPGSLRIRGALAVPGQRGFDASTKLHMGRKYAA